VKRFSFSADILICCLTVSTALLFGPAADAAEYSLPPDGDDIVGEVVTITAAYEDTFAKLAQRFSVGFQEIQDANPGLDPWLPGEGTQVRLPLAFVLPEGERNGIVINLAEFRLYYFPEAPSADAQRRVITYPIGIGRSEYPTPRTVTSVVRTIKDPWWTPGATARREYKEQGIDLPKVVPPGPDNPMGKFSMQLAIPSYFIHGTNKPLGVGQRASLGCIRLYPDDIEALVSVVPYGTKVRIIDQPNKIGRYHGDLYLESHAYPDGERSLTSVVKEVIRISENISAVDWKLAENIAREATGIPGRVTATL
jgi:L,D-transpeptidase ErfK/SrfK